MSRSITTSLRRSWASALLAVVAPFSVISGAGAQDGAALRPGEAYVTRFSGTTGDPGNPVIDLEGTSGNIIDVRNPGRPPLGQHWIDEPQRLPARARDVGQVFGVALDGAQPPNVYLTATAAFGLHRTADNAGWMPGMWGQGGDPGTIYRLSAADGYRPRPFARVTLGGRANSAAALGNITYDRWHDQLLVSDMETGMIHRIAVADGRDLGTWDHGTDGRKRFTDAQTKQAQSLPPIAFDPDSRARTADCPIGPFANTPECWNIARSGRRVWGVGAMRNASSGEVRLYYAVWSSPAFGNTAWASLSDEEKRNSIWSVRLGPDGAFDGADVRREFLLPDFFVAPASIARAGHSQPVSDISFPACGNTPIMLVAERGGMRNLGLGVDNAFATPSEARALRYEFDQEGAWRLAGRYDVGFYDRKDEGQPFQHANCAGGIAFGYGYNQSTWTMDPAKPGRFVWITGDRLCSPEGPCNLPGETSGAAAGPLPGPKAQPAAATGLAPPGDDSQVHGIQGLSEELFDEVAPAGAYASRTAGEAYPSTGLNQSYLIDTDINVDASGQPIEVEIERNDATRIGDIAIYEICETRPLGFLPVPAAATTLVGGHEANYSHRLYASHGRSISHFRYGSHAPIMSHNRHGSHYRHWSHHREGSHDKLRSHHRYGTHNLRLSHSREPSHHTQRSHHRHKSHTVQQSHDRTRSHSTQRSHAQHKSHSPQQSHARDRSHSQHQSHAQHKSHSQQQSHARDKSHAQHQSHAQNKSHSQQQSHARDKSHAQHQSHAQNKSHSQQQSHAQHKSHAQQQSHARTKSHTTAASHGPVVKKGVIKVHTVALSQATKKHVIKPVPKFTPKVTPKFTPKFTPKVTPKVTHKKFVPPKVQKQPVRRAPAKGGAHKKG